MGESDFYTDGWVNVVPNLLPYDELDFGFNFYAIILIVHVGPNYKFSWVSCMYLNKL